MDTSLDEKVKQARLRGVPEDAIQRRLQEIGVDKQPAQSAMFKNQNTLPNISRLIPKPIREVAKGYVADPTKFTEAQEKGGAYALGFNLANAAPPTPDDAIMAAGKGLMAGTMKFAPKVDDVVKGIAKSAPKVDDVYTGAKSLTLKTLEKLKGRSNVSKEFIENLTNASDLKQAEKDLLRSKLVKEGGQINVPKFAKEVEEDLLPLKYQSSLGGEPKHESIVLPDSLRGPVANYHERVYESPIKTSAGNRHFRDGTDNYFAHTRVEDLPPAARDIPTSDNMTFDPNRNVFLDANDRPYQGTTRRVIEIQSDLFQRGGLKKEKDLTASSNPANIRILEDMAKNETWNKKQYAIEQLKRKKELDKLEPYRNTWHERVIREEVKQAALDGKTKLQFPVGETAMKIEHLWDDTNFRIAPPVVKNSYGGIEVPDLLNLPRAKPESLKVGMRLHRQSNGGVEHNGWIVTDVLGNGKFKAISEAFGRWKIEKQPNGKYTAIQYEGQIGDKPYRALTDTREVVEDWLNKHIEENTSQFDLSNKVNTEHPIYNFYEKNVSKYLTSKYGAKRIKDPQGAEWMEIDVKPEQGKMPIEAFAAAPFLLMNEEIKKKVEDARRRGVPEEAIQRRLKEIKNQQ